jgi:hypothetical protein
MPGIKIWAGLLMMFLGTTAEAESWRGTSFADAGDFSTSCNLYMTLGDNLLIRVGGVDMSVVDAGYGAGYWNLGLTDDRGYVVGWAKNSSKLVPGRAGRLTGKYSGSALYGLTNGEKPIHAYLVYDSTGNGWDIVDSVLGSLRDLDDGDLFFDETSILFGPAKLRGDLGGIDLLPGYPLSGPAILPSMTVVIVPEPKPVSDPNDLAILSENWLWPDCKFSNGYCDGADIWHPDGKVDFLDFVELAARWLGCVQGGV